MGRNTTAMKRGWNYDKPNSRLKAMVDGKEAFALEAGTAGTYGSYGLLQSGTGKPTSAYEALAYMVDGYNVNLATDYASAFTRKYALDIEADTGSTDLTGNVNVGAIQGRVVAGTTQTNCGISGVVGVLDVGTVNLQGNFNGACGVLDFYGSCTLGTGAACYGAGLVSVVWNEANTTLGAGAVLSGVDIIENGAVYAYGSGAVNPAVYIRGNWQYGIYIPTGATSAAAITIGLTGNHFSMTGARTALEVYADAVAPTGVVGGSAAYFDTTISGVVTGAFNYGFGNWVNLATSFDGTATTCIIAAQNNGIYATTLTEAATTDLVYGMRAECVTAATVRGLYAFSLNANQDTTATYRAIFYCDQPECVGYTLTNRTTQIGSLAIAFINGSGHQHVAYVNLYEA